MKKVLLVCVVLAAACGKETPAPQPAAPATPPPKVATSGPVPETTPVPTLTREGNYDKAVAWMRNTPGYRFDIAIGDVKASGELTRAEAGKEKIHFRAGNDEWSADRKLTGVSWFRNGKHEANEPPYADRIYQWLTYFPDPQKSNVQVVGTEGDTTHVRFTTTNTNETEDLWIRGADSHLVRLTTSGAGSAFPKVEINIK